MFNTSPLSTDGANNLPIPARRGLQLEIAFELILRHTPSLDDLITTGNQLVGPRQFIREVVRNVHYYPIKGSDEHRQIDVLANTKNSPDTSVVFETKYSSGGNISYTFRDGILVKQNQQVVTIDNKVEEVVERHLFTGARLSYLVTNTGFNRRIVKEARKYPYLFLMNGAGLNGTYQKAKRTFNMGNPYLRRLSSHRNVQDFILAIEIDRHRNVPYSNRPTKKPR